MHKFLSILHIFGQEFWLFSIHAKVKEQVTDALADWWAAL